MAIESELQKLALDAKIELFVLDVTSLGGSVLRFHNGLNELKSNVVWNGDTYTAYPIAATGFEMTGQGTMPRPRLTVAGIDGLMGAQAKSYNDLVGAKLTRIRTLKKYLDAVNFSGGVNPDADPTQKLPDEVFFVSRKVGDNSALLEFELTAAFDVEGTKLPRRQVIRNLCAWQYKSSECGYSGGPVADINDQLTSDAAQDACGKRLASCKLRFGENGELPYGGFPGAGQT